jgi:LPXTG-site transpeptidase (sortase) family protein
MSATPTRRPARQAPTTAPAPPRKSSRFTLALFLGALIVAAAAFILFVRGGSLSSIGIGSRSDDRSASALLQHDPNTPTIKDLNELRATYGDPPDATYGRIRIPAIDVDAPIGARVVGADGQMEDPTGPSDVVWYDFQNMPGFGGVPGQGHNAIFAGHVDRAAYLDYAGVNYIGAGIFYSIGDLDTGDIIELTIGDQTLEYMVAWVQNVNASDAEWSDLLSSDVGIDSITLITCGGQFDAATHSYTKRTLVRATRA